MGFLSWRRRSTRVVTAIVATAAVAVSTFFLGATIANAAERTSATTRPFTFMIRSDTTQRSFTSTSWVDVPGTHTALEALESSLMVVRFGAQSICEGPSGWCSVRIVGTYPRSGGQFEFEPADGNNFVWAWAGSSWGQTMMERHTQAVVFPTNPPSPQVYTVKVQVALRNGATRFRLQDWTLAVEIRP